jgi:hypothetical protein
MSSKCTNKRIRFSKEEDNQLKELVLEYDKDWNLISSLMDGKNIRQVKDRYLNILSPDLNRDPWTDEDDELLKQKINEIGKKWTKILEFFRNRTAISLKNRWLILEKKQTPKMKENPEAVIERVEDPKPETKKKDFWEEFDLVNPWFSPEPNLFWSSSL